MRIVTPLTDLRIRAAITAAAKKGKHANIFDGGGLYLAIQPTGAARWRLKYRFEGREKRLSFGPWPDMPLKTARKHRDDARAMIADGTDPLAERKAAKAGAARTFKVVAEEYLAKQKHLAPLTLAREQRLIRYMLPAIGAMPMASIKLRDLREPLLKLESDGKIVTAKKTRSLLGRIWRYAMATDDVEHDVTTALRDLLADGKVKHLAAITEPAKLGPMLRAMHAYVGQPTVTHALKLAPLLFVRPGELRKMEWAEVDLDKAEWVIPAERMKMRVPHLVPLSRQAVTILRSLELHTGGGRYVFPSVRGGHRPMSENTLSAALSACGYAGDVQTIHGFRATARTILDEQLRFRPDIIEHQLAHAVKDANGRAYNRTSFLPERAAMMQAWADFLDGQRADDGNKVVPIGKARKVRA